MREWTFRNKFGRFRIVEGLNDGENDFTLFVHRYDDYADYWAEGYAHYSPQHALAYIVEFEGEIY